MHARPESQLYISDPTLQLSHTLANGFYVGDDQEDLTPRLARIVRRTATAIGARRVVLVGYSAGGFAAARIGSRLPGSVALAFAARRSLGDPPLGHTVPLLDTVFPGHTGFEALHQRLGARVSLADTIPADSDQKLVWIQNTGDEDHRIHQFEPFCKDMGLALEGGVGSAGTVHLVSTYYGDGVPTTDRVLATLSGQKQSPMPVGTPSPLRSGTGTLLALTRRRPCPRTCPLH